MTKYVLLRVNSLDLPSIPDELLSVGLESKLVIANTGRILPLAKFSVYA